jgi:DNA-binding GntR family transcriptional regulator
MPAMARDRLLTAEFVDVFLRRLDNKTVARLFSRHLPEVRRAFIAAPSRRGFEAGMPHLHAAVDAAIGGDATAAAAGVGEWTASLAVLVDEFAELEKKDS